VKEKQAPFLEQAGPDVARPAFRRIVAKFGTNLLTAGTERLNLEVMAALVGQVARLHAQGVEVIIVSSGAVAAGRAKLGLKRSRRDIPFKQVLASVGQSCLMDAYDKLFQWHDITVAQTLLTRADLSDRLRYLNARNTLLALLELGVIPIVNENDVVAVEEIQDLAFGDNDNLSAMVANLVDADLLVILTDIDGLYTADPRIDARATLIRHVDHIDAYVEGLAGGSGSSRGTGGMATKIQAAKLATAGGTAVAIAEGRARDVLLRLAGGEPLGTIFTPISTRLESRKRWLLGGASRRGKIVLDQGAVTAVRDRGCSLLPAGITRVKGRFQRGEPVDLVDSEGNSIACGISNYSSADVELIKGCQSRCIEERLGYEYGEEVVHRNNLVLL